MRRKVEMTNDIESDVYVWWCMRWDGSFCIIIVHCSQYFLGEWQHTFTFRSFFFIICYFAWHSFGCQTVQMLPVFFFVFSLLLLVLFLYSIYTWKNTIFTIHMRLMCLLYVPKFTMYYITK